MILKVVKKHFAKLQKLNQDRVATLHHSFRRSQYKDSCLCITRMISSTLYHIGETIPCNSFDSVLDFDNALV